MRGAFTDEKVIMVIAPDDNTKISPEAHEAKITVCITALPIKNGSAQIDSAQLKQLHEHLTLALDDSGLTQHADTSNADGKYAGVEATTRKGVTTVTMYASDPETLEHILADGLQRMHVHKVDTAFDSYPRRF